ncbi:XkdX family protein [Lachnoclostridium sp.]|nr:XkdX family protein [Lachnoclostridium sp.]
MYETLKRIYINTRNLEVLIKAEEKGWITEEQKQQIIDDVTK